MADNFGRYRFRPGWIEVIVGCMFSGKTEELIKQLTRAKLARQNFQVFKPEIDDRYHETDVASHNKNTFPSIPVKSAEEIYSHIRRNTDVVGIDEGQFFDNNVIEVATKLANAGKRVVVAGLDTDWRGEPFGPMPQLLAIADVIHKQYAICMSCGEPATRTQRLVAAQQSVLVGSTESYEARCRSCFDPTLSIRLGQIAKTDAENVNSL